MDNQSDSGEQIGVPAPNAGFVSPAPAQETPNIAKPPQPQSMAGAPASQAKKSFAKHIGMAVFTVIVIIALLFVIFRPISHSTGTTVTTTAQPSSATTTVSNATKTINLTALVSKENVTFGIPQNQEMQLGNPSTGTGFVSATYGLNFTLPFTYNNATYLIIPAQYSKMTTPFLVTALVWNFSSNERATAVYDGYLVTEYAPSNEFVFNSLSVTTQRPSVVGTNSTALSFDIGGMRAYEFLFVYRNYMVQIDTFGDIGYFNSPNYTYDIANRIYSQIKTVLG